MKSSAKDYTPLFVRRAEPILHVLVWSFFFIMLLMYGFEDWHLLSSGDKVLEIFALALIPSVFYLNAYALVPRFLVKKMWVKYALFLLLLLIGFELFRTLASMILLEKESNNFFTEFGLKFSGKDSFVGGFVTMVFLSLGYRFMRDWIVNLYRIEALEAERSRMELAFLRSQVDPHFLFNTLNGLYAMALEENANKTSDGITKLGGLMRYSLPDSQATRISLSKEIEYIENYIQLQKLRTSEKNQVSYKLNIDGEESKLQQIAPMLLIPFIENAFKYGIHPSKETTIEINISVKKSMLVLEVKNTVVSEKPLHESSGIGLVNLKERLDLLYPEQHTLRTTEEYDEFMAYLSLNLKK